MVEKTKKARDKNEEVVRIVEEMKKAEVSGLQEKEWQIKKDLLLKEEKVYVLKDKELRVKIIQLHHNVPVEKYRGKQKTMELVIRDYWQSGVMRDMRGYVEGCDICQQINNRLEVLVRKVKIE